MIAINTTASAACARRRARKRRKRRRVPPLRQPALAPALAGSMVYLLPVLLLKVDIGERVVNAQSAMHYILHSLVHN